MNLPGSPKILGFFLHSDKEIGKICFTKIMSETGDKIEPYTVGLTLEQKGEVESVDTLSTSPFCGGR